VALGVYLPISDLSMRIQKYIMNSTFKSDLKFQGMQLVMMRIKVEFITHNRQSDEQMTQP
jgi:fibronectin type 3 domain-containing protein